MELVIPVVDRFRGAHFFLSNFFPAVTPHRGRLFPTSEHAFVAAKTNDPAAVEAICAAQDPAEAKQIGQSVPLVNGWETERFAVMEEILAAKFGHNDELAQRLVDTGGALLVEGNTWHDQVWGSCRCAEHYRTPGANALGILLMRVRLEMKTQGCG